MDKELHRCQEMLANLIYKRKEMASALNMSNMDNRSLPMRLNIAKWIPSSVRHIFLQLKKCFFLALNKREMIELAQNTVEFVFADDEMKKAVKEICRMLKEDYCKENQDLVAVK